MTSAPTKPQAKKTVSARVVGSTARPKGSARTDVTSIRTHDPARYAMAHWTILRSFRCCSRAGIRTGRPLSRLPVHATSQTAGGSARRQEAPARPRGMDPSGGGRGGACTASGGWGPTREPRRGSSPTTPTLGHENGQAKAFLSAVRRPARLSDARGSYRIRSRSARSRGVSRSPTPTTAPRSIAANAVGPARTHPRPTVVRRYLRAGPRAL